MRYFLVCCACVAALAAGRADAQLSNIVFSEDFESLAGSLGASVNERQGFPLVTRVANDTDSAPVPNVFSASGPAGWMIDNDLGTFGGSSTIGNTGVPGQGVFDYGVDEWEGWGFANKDFWVEAAGQQERELFTKGVGTVAVADPDEYFDLDPLDGLSSGGPSNATHGGFYNTGLKTPSINMAALGSVSAGVNLKFDSSYRLEANDDDHPDAAFNNLNNQAAEVIAVFDTGETQTLPVFDSVADTDDDVNGSLEFNFFPATNASSVEFQFNLANAGNDWWWAIDNIAVADIDINTGLPLAASFTEDFEGVALGDSINERASLVPSKVTAENTDSETTPRPNSFTHTPPTGWNASTTDSNGGGTIGDDNVGVYEWEGWSFATPEFWTFADTQDRELFKNGTGVIAVADGDEWDDLNNPDGTPADNELQTMLETPSISVPAMDDEASLVLMFDSSWRAEDDQTAVITADYGNGPVEVLRWESDSGSANFHDDNVNEQVLVFLDPASASEFTLAFSYSGRDDWWWAIDNVKVGTIPEPASVMLLSLVAYAGFGTRRRAESEAVLKGDT